MKQYWLLFCELWDHIYLCTDTFLLDDNDKRIDRWVHTEVRGVLGRTMENVRR